MFQNAPLFITLTLLAVYLFDTITTAVVNSVHPQNQSEYLHVIVWQHLTGSVVFTREAAAFSWSYVKQSFVSLKSRFSK